MILHHLKTTNSIDLTANEEAIVAESVVDKQSSIIKVITIIGAILTSILLVAFILIIGLYESPIGMITTGTLFLILSTYLSKKTNEIFLDTILSTAYGIGYAFVGFGLSEIGISEAGNSGLILLISFLALLYIENYILVFFSTLLCIGTSVLLLYAYDLSFLIPIYSSIMGLSVTFFILKEAQIINYSKHLAAIYEPVKFALILSFIIALINPSAFIYANIELPALLLTAIPIVTAVIILGTLLYITSFILKRLQIRSIYHKLFLYVFSLIILIPTSLQPGIIGSLLLILLCFYTHYRAGFAIGILSFLYFITVFYYDMEVTLLVKSILLISNGLLFLLFYLITTRTRHIHEKD